MSDLTVVLARFFQYSTDSFEPAYMLLDFFRKPEKAKTVAITNKKGPKNKGKGKGFTLTVRNSGVDTNMDCDGRDW